MWFRCRFFYIVLIHSSGFVESMIQNFQLVLASFLQNLNQEQKTCSVGSAKILTPGGPNVAADRGIVIKMEYFVNFSPSFETIFEILN